MKGSYLEVCGAESRMTEKYNKLYQAICAYRDAVDMLKKFNTTTIYRSTVGEYFTTEPKNNGRMLVEYECVPKKFYGRGTGSDKQAFTRGQWQRLIRKLKDDVKQKNREYTRAYLEYVELSEGPQNFEKRQQEIRQLEQELKEANNKVVLIKNRLDVLKK